MATSYYYTGYAQGSFKTAYLQKAVVLDVICGTTEEAHVGDVFSLTNGTLSLIAGASSSYATSSAGYAESAITAAKSLVSQGQYIIAQADMTLEYGHVPVEYRDYKYSDVVKLDSSVYTSENTKRIMAYPIYDVNDIEISGRYKVEALSRLLEIFYL